MFVVVVAAEYAWIDVIEIWTIAVICIMLMGNAGINNAVLARTAVNSQVNNHVIDIRLDAGKTKEKSISYV